MINDDTIGIRRFRPEDVVDLASATRESMAQVRKWMVWCRADHSPADCLEFIRGCEEDWQSDRRYSFVIHDIAQGTLLGSISISGIDRAHRMASLGYWVRTSQTGRGVGSAAVRLAAQFAFEKLRLHRLELIIARENHGSIRVAENAGAQREGLLRRRLMLDGRPADALLYSILPSDLVRAPAVRQARGSQTAIAAELAFGTA